MVRFPGDWIGPDEELIPFGPAADRAAEDNPPTLPSANDFWGEHAAAIHSVLESPATASPPDETPTPSADPATRHVGDGVTARRDRTPPAFRRWRRWSVAQAATPPDRAQTTRGLGLRSAPRARAWAGAVALMVGLGIVVSVVLGASPRVGRGRAGRAGGFLAAAGHSLGTSTGIADAVRREHVTAPGSGQRPRAARRAATARHGSGRRRPPAASPSSTSVAVRLATPQAGGPSVSTVAPATNYVAPATDPSTGSVSTGSSESRAVSSGSGSSSGTGSAPAGPVGPGAPFGPGHLG